MTIQPRDLATQSRDRLDAIFRDSSPGPIPVGRTRGSALIFAGSAADTLIRPLIRALIWKGKVFRPEREDLKNLLSPLGIHGIRARVYQGQSWFDGKPAIIIDYARTSLVARMVRDEIRQVGPGLYLGQIFLWKKRVGHFMLEATLAADTVQKAPVAETARATPRPAGATTTP